MDDLTHIPLPGSFRAPAPGSRTAEPVPAAAEVEVTLVLRRRSPLPPAAGPASGPPRTLSREQLADRHGAGPDDVTAVVERLGAEGLRVLEVDRAGRRVRVAGTAEAMSATFGVRMTRATTPDPTTDRPVEHRQREGELSLPAGLGGVVVAVLGLDDRPQTRAHFRPAAAAATSYTPVELGRVYRFPDGTDGRGQTLAVIELGGGYRDADLTAYFGGLGLATPSVRSVGVDGAANGGGHDPQGADGEVLLDIEVAGALAPGSELVVYFAPNTDAGFLDAVTVAAHASPTPTAMSISWGQSEDEWTAQARTAMDEAFADAAALGITVCVAAGDDGSSDRAVDGGVHVDFPAASPHALACGGTRLVADGASGEVSSETVWNAGTGRGATGGGVSDTFGLPDWQQQAGVPAAPGGGTGRGVPDVAGDADPATGYQVLVDGQRLVFGGTSAVAPLWAALVCRLAQASGRRPGLLQPALYAAVAPGAEAPGLRDVTVGDNGAYAAGPGWDACTGLGVPDGEALVALLSARR